MKPLILDYQISRLEQNNSFEFIYDYQKSMNVVLINGCYESFIDIKTADLEFATKTRMTRENDDDNFFQTLGTETKVARETSDHYTLLLELETKTFTKRERDDEGSFNN